MLIIVAAALSVGAAVLAPVQNAPPLAPYDVVGNVFSADQRKMIGRDAQCSDARASADAFAQTNGRDIAVAVSALNAIERCASRQRIGDWKDYSDYLWTAAAGIAYDIGMIANEPKGLQHAVAAAKNVSGFQEPASKSIETTTASASAPSSTTTSGDTNGQATLAPSRSKLGNAVNTQTDAGLPQANNAHYQAQSQHVAGYSGAFGVLATDIAAAAERALSVSSGSAR